VRGVVDRRVPWNRALAARPPAAVLEIQAPGDHRNGPEAEQPASRAALAVVDSRHLFNLATNRLTLTPERAILTLQAPPCWLSFFAAASRLPSRYSDPATIQACGPPPALSLRLAWILAMRGSGGQGFRRSGRGAELNAGQLGRRQQGSPRSSSWDCRAPANQPGPSPEPAGTGAARVLLLLARMPTSPQPGMDAPGSGQPADHPIPLPQGPRAAGTLMGPSSQQGRRRATRRGLQPAGQRARSKNPR